MRTRLFIFLLASLAITTTGCSQDVRTKLPDRAQLSLGALRGLFGDLGEEQTFYLHAAALVAQADPEGDAREAIEAGNFGLVEIGGCLGSFYPIDDRGTWADDGVAAAHGCRTSFIANGSMFEYDGLFASYGFDYAVRYNRVVLGAAQGRELPPPHERCAAVLPRSLQPLTALARAREAGRQHRSPE